jgi:hypothetical protein
MGFYEAKRQNDAIKLEPDLKGYREKFFRGLKEKSIILASVLMKLL